MKNTWIDAIRYLCYDFFLKYRLLANRFLIYHRIVRPFYLKLDRDVNYILGVGSEFGQSWEWKYYSFKAFEFSIFVEIHEIISTR